MENVDVPFPKPPEDGDDGNEVLLAALDNRVIQILQIRCDIGSVPQDDNNSDVDAFNL